MIDVQLLALVGASALLPEVAIPSELHALDSASIDAAWADIADIVLIPLQEWNAMSSVDFQSFAAIAIPGCGQSRLIDREVSGPAIGAATNTAPKIIIAAEENAGVTVSRAWSAFTVSDPSKTGLYISLCGINSGANAFLALAFPDAVGQFTTVSVDQADPTDPDCNIIEITGTHAVLDSLTSAQLSGLGCSLTAFFEPVPAGWTVFALGLSFSGKSSYTAPNGVEGQPYIITQGAHPLTTTTASTSATTTQTTTTTPTTSTTTTMSLQERICRRRCPYLFPFADTTVTATTTTSTVDVSCNDYKTPCDCHYGDEFGTKFARIPGPGGLVCGWHARQGRCVPGAWTSRRECRDGNCGECPVSLLQIFPERRRSIDSAISCGPLSDAHPGEVPVGVTASCNGETAGSICELQCSSSKDLFRGNPTCICQANGRWQCDCSAICTKFEVGPDPNYEYYYSLTRQAPDTTFEDAQNSCNAMGADLASVYSKAENDFIASLDKTKRTLTRSRWLGFKRDREADKNTYPFQYIAVDADKDWLGSGQQPSKFGTPAKVLDEFIGCTNDVDCLWVTGEPNDLPCTKDDFKIVFGVGTASCEGNEDCIAMGHSDATTVGAWNDAPCSKLFSYVCKRAIVDETRCITTPTTSPSTTTTPTTSASTTTTLTTSVSSTTTHTTSLSSSTTRTTSVSTTSTQTSSASTTTTHTTSPTTTTTKTSSMTSSKTTSPTTTTRTTSDSTTLTTTSTLTTSLTTTTTETTSLSSTSTPTSSMSSTTTPTTLSKYQIMERRCAEITCGADCTADINGGDEALQCGWKRKTGKCVPGGGGEYGKVRTRDSEKALGPGCTTTPTTLTPTTKTYNGIGEIIRVESDGSKTAPFCSWAVDGCLWNHETQTDCARGLCEAGGMNLFDYVGATNNMCQSSYFNGTGNRWYYLGEFNNGYPELHFGNFVEDVAIIARCERLPSTPSTTVTTSTTTRPPVPKCVTLLDGEIGQIVCEADEMIEIESVIFGDKAVLDPFQSGSAFSGSGFGSRFLIEFECPRDLISCPFDGTKCLSPDDFCDGESDCQVDGISVDEIFSPAFPKCIEACLSGSPLIAGCPGQNLCAEEDSEPLPCSSSGPTEVGDRLLSLCKGRSSCTLIADNRVFGVTSCENPRLFVHARCSVRPPPPTTTSSTSATTTSQTTSATSTDFCESECREFETTLTTSPSTTITTSPTTTTSVTSSVTSTTATTTQTTTTATTSRSTTTSLTSSATTTTTPTTSYTSTTVTTSQTTVSCETIKCGRFCQGDCGWSSISHTCLSINLNPGHVTKENEWEDESFPGACADASANMQKAP